MDPKPRLRPLPVEPLAWPVQRNLSAPSAVPTLKASFQEVLLNRRSTRMLRPARLREIVSAVALATRSQFVASSGPSSRFKRPSPSAGALHPFRTVVASLHGGARAFLCDPDCDCLAVLRLRRPDALRVLRVRLQEMLPEARGVVVVLIGDPTVTDAYYEASQTLFWRDAGALLQTLLSTFEACGLGACAGGISGAEIITALDLDPRALAGGLLIVGHKAVRGG